MSIAVAAPPSPTLDPITVEVIGAALSSIVEETGEALIRASYSTNIKERRDCSTALFDVQGRTLCQAEHIPIHLGSFIGIVPHVLNHHPIADMRPGDVFIGNDPYAGSGTHLPDIVMAEPIFVDGTIVAWTVNLAHHADFADRGHAHIYQEGLRIPPIRLYRAGELQQDVLDLVLLNCQVPRERLSDLRAQMAANRVGVRRFQALCAKYGVATVLAAGDALLDYAERKMRAAIAAIPDGIYRFSDVFDSAEIDGELPMSVEITVFSDAMKLHFVSPPQVRAGINMTYTALLATVYYAVKSVVDPTILPNSNFCTTGFGNLGRNTYRGPGQQNWDFSLIKNFKLTERQSLRFTTDFFNLWNHPNFANPATTDVESIGLANSPFGKITSTLGTPRLIQFSLRYAF